MEFGEIVVKDTPGLCRCCLSEGCYKDLGTEYPWMEDTEVYADMLLECFDVSISQHIEGPNGPNRLICEVCITRLRDACNFKKQVLDSEKKFIDMVGRGAFKPKVLLYPEQMKSETQEVPVEEAEIEYLEEEVDYDDIPLNELAEPSVSDDITVATLPVATKRGRPKKTVKTEKKKKLEEKVKPKSSKDQGPYDHCTSERRRKNLQMLFNNTSILPFKWRGRYLCFYCGQSYTNYPELKKHTKSHGLCSTSDYALKIIKGNHIEIKIDVSEIVCEICFEAFLTLNEILDHIIVKHEMDYDKTVDTSLREYRLSDCRCQFCDKEFSYFGYLINHTNIAHSENCFACDSCGATFNKKRDLALHIRHYHREGGYPCDECSQVFDSHLLRRRHANSVHYRKCKLCDSRFPSYILLQKHIKCDHPSDESQKFCPYCSKECQSSQGIKQHMKKCKMKKQTNVSTSSVFPDDNDLQPNSKQNVMQIRKNIQCVLNMSTAVPFKFFAKFSCFYCSKYFVEFDELKEHVVAQHPICDLKEKCIRNCKGDRITVKIDISTLSCRVCYQPISDLDELIHHLTSKHLAAFDKTIKCFEPFRIIKDNIPCPICPSVFRYFGILLRHINSEHSNNNRICDFCGRSFKNVSNLKVHITYAHTGACECEICGLKFKNQWCLGRHKAKSHDAKDYKCPKCPERFQSQYHKQKHLIKVHDIGHKCTFCDRMFTRNSFMKDHVRRTHLKEKNVQCSVCNEKFFDNYLLRMHMVKHKGERKFSCEVCGKTFLRRSNLSSHKEMHKKYGHV